MDIFKASIIKKNRLNLGCSKSNISSNYLNIGLWDHLVSDVVFKNPIIDDGSLLASLNVMKGLPFLNESISVIYNANLISLNGLSSVTTLCDEVYRCLEVGGKLRLFEPDANSIIKSFLNNHYSLSDLRNSTYSENISSNDLFTELLQKRPGLMACDFCYLEPILKKRGFKNIRRSLYLSSQLPDINVIEYANPFYAHHSLCIECEK
jgi:hypothetical protein